jgi:gamma-glutamylcyclotransferase (GGCT)/AIG2-like uncharacterized protein YtfP
MKFFVYGTLKVGGHFADRFDEVRVSSVKATLKDHALYNLGWFPTTAEEKGSIVVGEVHEYEKEEVVLRHFDRIEGYTEGGDDNLYDRKVVKVETESGVEEAYAYIFARNLPEDAELIESGEWQLSQLRD